MKMEFSYHDHSLALEKLFKSACERKIFDLACQIGRDTLWIIDRYFPGENSPAQFLKAKKDYAEKKISYEVFDQAERNLTIFAKTVDTEMMKRRDFAEKNWLKDLLEQDAEKHQGITYFPFSNAFMSPINAIRAIQSFPTLSPQPNYLEGSISGAVDIAENSLQAISKDTLMKLICWKDLSAEEIHKLVNTLTFFEAQKQLAQFKFFLT